MAESKVKKFLLVSCLGCFGLLLLVMVALLLIGWTAGRKAEFAEEGAAYEPETVFAADVPTFEELSDSPEFGEVAGFTNRVELTIDGVEKVRVRPCDPGEGMAVKADYNKKSIDFSETLERNEDGRWTYRVSMTRGGGDLMQLVERIFSGRESSLDLCLPQDTPIELNADLARGGIEAELGGLWLTDTTFALDRGGAFVSFDEPLRAPVRSMSIDVNMGGVMFHQVGNASPAELTLDYRFGGFNFDLTGEWKQDSVITLSGAASGVNLSLPRGVAVEGMPDDKSANAGDGPPTLMFAPGAPWKDIEVSWE